MKAADGTTLTGEPQIRARLAAYFEELYRVNRLVSCDPPTLEGTTRPVNQLKCGKAPGGVRYLR